MSGSVEYGICDICKKEAILQRTYFRYDIKCECHSPYHFEMIRHCNNCIPKEPLITNITIKTANLKDLSVLLRKKKLEKINGSS
jgi:hypothetical protein